MGDISAFAFAFGLTLLAGLSTGIGSALSLLSHTTNTKFLSISLGFSAGVMIYVSLIEIFFDARMKLMAVLGDKPGYWVTLAAFFGGILFIALIDFFVPEVENPHEMRRVEEMDQPSEVIRKKRLMRMGMLSAMAIAVHNFPEGIATFVAALNDPGLGIAIAVAIAIHNIPEGIAVAVPIYYATRNRKKAFRLSFLSGLAEPVGALIGLLILLPFMNDILYGILFAAVAGIMVFISVDELLPAAREYGRAHYSIYGFIGGLAVMGISLVLLA